MARRKSLAIDDALLERALRLSGETSRSAVVNRALAELVERLEARQILRLAGEGLRDGDLSTMRGESPRGATGRVPIRP